MAADPAEDAGPRAPTDRPGPSLDDPRRGFELSGKRSKRRRGQPHATPAQDQRPLERRGLGQAGGEPGLGLDRAAPNRGLHRAGQAGRSGHAGHIGEPGQRSGQLALEELVEVLVARLVGVAQDRREREPGEADREDEVAHRDDVLDDREGHRDDVGERSAPQQERRAGGVVDDRVERRVDVSLGEAGGREGRRPDRHRAAVEQDRDEVGEGAGQDQPEAHHAPVDPAAGEQEREGEREQRQPELGHAGDAGVERDLRPEPDDGAQGEQPEPAQASGVRDEVRDAAAEQEAGKEADDDPGDEHRLARLGARRESGSLGCDDGAGRRGEVGRGLAGLGQAGALTGQERDDPAWRLAARIRHAFCPRSA